MEQRQAVQCRGERQCLREEEALPDLAFLRRKARPDQRSVVRDEMRAEAGRSDPVAELGIVLDAHERPSVGVSAVDERLRMTVCAEVAFGNGLPLDQARLDAVRVGEQPGEGRARLDDDTEGPAAPAFWLSHGGGARRAPA